MDKNNNRLYTNIFSSYTDEVSTYTTTLRLQTAHTFPITPKLTQASTPSPLQTHISCSPISDSD